MNGVICTIKQRAEQILCGDHYIIQSVKMADGIKNLKAGELLCASADGMVRGTAGDASYDAVLLDDFALATDETVLNVCVHGTVKAEKLILEDAPATEAVRAKLQAKAIYAVGALAPVGA